MSIHSKRTTEKHFLNLGQWTKDIVRVSPINLISSTFVDRQGSATKKCLKYTLGGIKLVQYNDVWPILSNGYCRMMLSASYIQHQIRKKTENIYKI